MKTRRAYASTLALQVKEDRRVHLAALVERPQHVCCRYRLAAFRPHLEAAGHRLDLVPCPRSLWGRFRLGSQLSHFDAVILQRRLLPTWLLNRLRRRVRRLYFDLDDAIYLRDSHDRRGLHDPRRLERFAAVCRACDGIIAGNDFLAEEARRQGARAVHVIPTCVDPALYPQAQTGRMDGAQLVWIGSSSTLRGLRQITPHLEHIGRHCPGVRLKLVCDAFLRLEHLPIDEVHWSEAGEAHELASADIGIAWVPDDDWSRGKCGLKVLQYMAAGLPVVANPVGVQRAMVRHGETGFHASTPEDWARAIAILANDPGLRRRMGAAGRRRVETEFSVAAGAALWLGVLEETRCLPSAI
jgi:glycosyltransferase involved in cell wall biosynthesis